jgi:hypothetical protein
VDAVLRFARNHQDGRYLVEVVNPWNTRVAFDARAMNSYLGAQGNETLSTVFHEASPTALFSLPVVNAFSQYPDSFGISSVLSDDLDFHTQPLADHIKRAQALGTRYLVIHTPEMKERLGKEAGVGIRDDFGAWSVFELRGAVDPHARALPYKPALVVSDFTLKQRRRHEPSYIRLVEEQFNDNWFDVLLVRSPEMRLDRLPDIDEFGALIVDAYDYADEDAAYNLLRTFAQSRQLVLMSDDSALFAAFVQRKAIFRTSQSLNGNRWKLVRR